MAHCKHECCGTAEKVWLPYELEGRSRGLVPHSYCIHCGVVKSISSKSNRAKRMGYYRIYLQGGESQILSSDRLIAKELERIQDFDDVYSMTRSEQEGLFIDAVKKYSKVREDTIRAFL